MNPSPFLRALRLDDRARSRPVPSSTRPRRAGKRALPRMLAGAAVPLWAAAMAGGLLAGSARADGDRSLRVPPLPAYRQECAACHVAYPPGLLPAASWQRLLANLPQHFGTDASVDPATLRQISDWMAPLAGTARKLRRETAAPPEDRITRSAWFVREHRAIAPAVWERAAVKRPSNCVACHAQAEQGDFNEHAVRIPR